MKRQPSRFTQALAAVIAEEGWERCSHSPATTMNTDDFHSKFKQLQRKYDCIAPSNLPPFFAAIRDVESIRAAADSELRTAEWRLCVKAADAICRLPGTLEGQCTRCRCDVIYDPSLPLGAQQLICVDCALAIDESTATV